MTDDGQNTFSSVFGIRKTGIPLRLFGSGIYLSWLFTLHFSTNLFSVADMALDAFMVSNAVNLFVLLTVALLSKKIAPLSSKTAFIIFAGVSGAAGTILMAFSSATHQWTISSFLFGNVLTGASTGFLILLWSELYASIPRRDVSIIYSGSFILAAVLYYLSSSLAGAMQTALIVSMPAASTFSFVLSRNAVGDSLEQSEESSSSQWSIPWRASILLAIYAFVSTLSRSMSFESTDSSMLGMLLIALFVLVCAVFFYDRFDIRLLYKATPPLLVAGLLAISFFNDTSGLGSSLINAGFSGFIILALIVMSNISYSYGVTAIWLFGLTRAARVIASMAAIWGHAQFSSAGVFDSRIAGAFCIVLVTTSAMFLLSEKEFLSAWGLTPKPERKPSKAAEFYDSPEGRCAIVAKEYGLTQREEEVLVLLSRDCRIADIEESLFISNSTAKSHIRHIYAKLDVHSRDEVIKLVSEQ